MPKRPLAGLAGTLAVLLAAALLALPPSAEARGGRRGGSGGGAKPAPAPAKVEKDRSDGGLHITIRTGSSSPSQGYGGSTMSRLNGGGGSARMPLRPIAPEADATPEELERRAAALAAYEKAMAETAAAQAAARKAAAEQAEADRLAAEKAAADRAAQKAAAERAEAARQAAAAEKKQREEAAVAAEVERVLARARSDHPVLDTPEGEPLLRSILQRQQVLLARGLYPSVAMVEAVADHADALRPRRRADSLPAVQAAAPAPPDHSKTYGNCRWVTPYQWSCK